MRWIKRITVRFEMEKRENDLVGIVYLPYEADVEVKMVADNDYGADADGNRGVYHEWIDDVEVLEVRDENGIRVNKVTPEMDKEIIEVVQDQDLSMEPDYGPD